MSETKHTPGPWHIMEFREAYSGRHTAFVHTTADFSGLPMGRVANLPYTDITRDIQQANARLIAASPELLESLNDAFDWVCELLPPYATGGERLDKIREALAKATGTD